MQDFYQWQDNDLLLNVRVQPRASKDEISGVHGNALKVRITAPPVDGKANRHLIQYLAGVFGVAKSAVELVSGVSGRDKRLLVHAPRKLPEYVRPAQPGKDSTRRT